MLAALLRPPQASDERAEGASRAAVLAAELPRLHIGRFSFRPGEVHIRQQQRLREICDFFDDAMTERLLVPIAKQEFSISLRLLDYTMTNWAKKTRIMVQLPTRTGLVPFNIFSRYKDWLKFYRRRCFDPFRRRERIYFVWTPPPPPPPPPPAAEAAGGMAPPPAEELDTTVAQLNFLCWAEKHGILEYVARHKEEIEEDMMRTLGDSKKRRQQPAAASSVPPAADVRKRKRSELSRAPAAKCMVYPIRQDVCFEAAGGEGEGARP